MIERYERMNYTLHGSRPYWTVIFEDDNTSYILSFENSSIPMWAMDLANWHDHEAIVRQQAREASRMILRNFRTRDFRDDFPDRKDWDLSDREVDEMDGRYL